MRKAERGLVLKLLNYRGHVMLFQAEQVWTVGAREADGEQGSELTTGDAPRDGVKCLVWKEVTVELLILSFNPICFHLGWDFQAPSRYYM